jgi:hypothetical protein
MNIKLNVLNETVATGLEKSASTTSWQTFSSLTLTKQARTFLNLNRLITALILIALYAGSATLARADDSECPNVGGAKSTVLMKRVTYLGPFNSTASDLRADPDDPNHTVRLRGWLYFKAKAVNKDKPVIIYNHGHNQEREEPCAMAKYFVDAGFVFFAPLRRGHKGKEGSQIRSTGVHLDDYIGNCVATGDCDCNRCDGGSFCPPNALEMDYLRQQSADVRAQLEYIKGLAAIGRDGNPISGLLADPRSIAILGHSYGGALTVYANARIPESARLQNVAINISGAELSWGEDEPFWESELTCAMEDQQRPIYFLQPKNGLSLLPTRTLFGKAIGKKYRSQASLFPAVPVNPDDPDPEARQVHAKFITEPEQVAIWGPSVIEFINRYPCNSCAP